MKHIHILGLNGTFMSALAILAREAGYHVTGCDKQAYPPVSDLLAEKGIQWIEGYDVNEAALSADEVVVGNTMKRGMPVLEAVLNKRGRYTSGPQWLAENILPNRRVIAVSGTHGKTTTTSMIAFILSEAGRDPGFLIGGVAPHFNTSARLGKGEWFVVEADEYDCALFDKRSKLMHYRPSIAVINNLEFDHADIFPDLAAIQRQFHDYLKTLPSDTTLMTPRHDVNLNAVIEKGCFSKRETWSFEGDADWSAKLLSEDGQSFEVYYQQKRVATVNWSLLGQFNVENGLAAIATCAKAGVEPSDAASILASFQPVKRRLELKSVCRGVTIYDDFAHHPTAVEKTLRALRNSQRHRRIIAIVELGSYTMRSGLHVSRMDTMLNDADDAFILHAAPQDLAAQGVPQTILNQATADPMQIVQKVVAKAQEGDAIIMMSNRSLHEVYDALVREMV